MAVSWGAVCGGGAAAPPPRAGHTFTTLAGGDTHVLFGGSGQGAGGRAASLADAHVCRVAPDSGAVAWAPLAVEGPAPPARARHTAVALDSKRMLVFGGLVQPDKTRLNDVWILDVGARRWEAAAPEGGPPPARAHHTATKVGNKVLVFGGYGGGGTAFGDLWVLHLGADGGLRWEEATLAGRPPAPRFDHTAVALTMAPNSPHPDKLVVLGGRDSTQSFTDVHVLDLKSMTWLGGHGVPPLHGEVCNHLCTAVDSVPYHKVFAGFGKSATLQYLNAVQVLDAGSKQWSTPDLAGGAQPCGREDAAWVWDARSFSLVLFGGWANRWLGDTWRADVSSVVGPGYACLGISPAIGPVAGGTEVTITGLRFRDGKIRVRLTSARGESVVDGAFVSAEALRFKTPTHEQHGALPCDVCVSIGSDSWTVNPLKFQYFSNMLSSACLAYGPGVLPQTYCGLEMPFLLVAKDTTGHKRTSGGDTFQVSLESEAGVVVGSARVVDRGTGTYECFFRAPAQGRYKLHVRGHQLGADGGVAHIRGSPFTVECSDPWEQRRLVGAAPARRPGATLTSLGTDLVVFGGDKSLAAVCHAPPAGDAAGEPWQWHPTAEGGRPPARKGHAAAAAPDGAHLLVCGGVALEGEAGAELADVATLASHGTSFAGTSWAWVAAGPAPQLHQRADGAEVPAERSGHCAVTLPGAASLLVFGGERQGQLTNELLLLDTSNKLAPRWVEPEVEGALPCARRGAAAAASGGSFVVLFGGVAAGEGGEDVTLGDLYLIEVQGAGTVRCAQQEAAGAAPPARWGALLQEHGEGKLLLYGGVGADGKPLGDAWLLDVASLTWLLLYDGTPETSGLPASLATLHGGRLLCLASAPGSTRLDVARSIDLVAARESVSFLAKMRPEVASAVKELETWVAKQQLGLDLGANVESLAASAEKLLKVMDGLYQIKHRRRNTDLLFDQLKEACALLAAEHRVKEATRLDKQLDELRTRWEGLKKAAPQVRTSIAAAQEAECERVKADIGRFDAAVTQYASSIYSRRGFFAWATGTEAAVADIGRTSKDLDVMRSEHARLETLGKLFGCSELLAGATGVIKTTSDELAALAAVWQCAGSAQRKLDEWNKTLFSAVNVSELEEGAKGLVKEVKALPKEAKEHDCFKGLDTLAKNYLASVPLVGDLRSPAMRPRHWEALQEATKVTFTLDESFRLEDLLRLQLHKYAEDVGEIVDRAQKEEKMETALVRLNDTWSKVVFVFSPHSGAAGVAVSTVKMAEEDFEALEDNQVLVQSMMANRFMATFRDEITSWNKKLNAVADVVAALAEIQRSWAYLESLFIQSEEVRKELPEATQRFAKIDSAVRGVLAEFAATRNVVGCCTRKGLLKHLEAQQGELELCEKALADYMESKRRAFPRFYFVSTADLLNILSNGNDPAHVQQHMSKCFQAIDRLKLDTSGGGRPRALGMESCVGTEYVAFKTPLPLEGKVEVYLSQVVDKMRAELRRITAESVADYPRKPRDKWLFDWPSQTILTVNQIFWCQEVEEAFEQLRSGDKDAMRTYNEKQVKQLTRLIEVTRTDLGKADRQKVMNMITIDAHSRDMVANIVEQGATDPSCFAWQSQLRSYWDSDIGDCRVRVCDAQFPYGHEYLGNGPRLVITPLTDRIYVTATQAMWLSLGTAPAGPAGTGKTETTKDLAAQMGKACYVFNCAPEMDYRSLGDIFKGLASSGSLGCFDEFNRLIPEVLSVCAVQYKCVTDAQRRKAALPGRGLEYVDSEGVKHPAVENVTFMAADGVTMPLQEGASVFITMNPGYIGRAELPESLKALFRPITVVVPDRQLIIENALMAEGFVTAKALAKKFAALYFLLEDLLSPQKHYDWGLRAIKSVLVVAGGLLRSQEGQDEQDVLYRALRDFNLPKILAQDLSVFNGLLGDIFPAVNPPRQRDPGFEATIKACAVELGLEPDEEFVKQVVSLSELLQIRHCVFLMGPSGCGRSEVIRVLAKAISAGCDKPTNPYLAANNRKKVVVRDLNPKSITTQELYGYVNMSTREWKDGLLSCTMRELANVPDDNPKWIILDGDLDANWIESANSVMDDNRLLTLPSNERIRLLPHMKLIFEIRDLRYATPATATRAGILYISEGQQWVSLVESWLRRVVRPYAEKAKWADPDAPVRTLRDLFARYVPPTLFELRKSFIHMVPLGTMNFVSTLCAILEGLLRPENLPAKCDPALFEVAFVFGAVWAFGGALCERDGIKYRAQFDKWWKLTWSTVRFPQKGTVYDYFVNFKAGKFAPWADLVQPTEYDGTVPMSQVFVPTPETVSLRFFLDMMVSLRKPIMFVGGPGTGKTQLVKGKLQALNEEQAALSISMNYFTDVVSFQRVLESQLEKKAGINYAPPANKQLIYFVDDLNLPRLDPYETAMPISLVRQHLGYGHWYDRQKLTQKNIGGTQYIACMNPTAGSFNIDPRLQRLFVTLAVETPGSDSLMKIYGTFLHSHLKRGFSQEVQELGTKLLQAALALHDRVMATFRRTAVTFHYEFTIRHITQVFQGLLQSTPEKYNADPTKLIRLWLHESERTYADRLVSAADLQQYGKIAVAVCKKYFSGVEPEEFYRAKDPRPLVFSHFAAGHGGDATYNEVADFKRLQRTLAEGLAEYNETNAVMDLVLFDDAIRHVCRIARIISNPGGHALLVGVGGSGKQSLARLAAHMCGYACEQIVISGSYTASNFAEDLARMYRRAGLKDEGVMFLLTDSQIVDQKMLVYLNDLLSSGEVPDLFTPEERDEIINAMRGEAKAQGVPDTNDNCWRIFIQRVIKNLHVAFTCSPVGDAFRIRSQRFLATVNSTVIDWFHPWPEASLHSVAEKFLADVTFEGSEMLSGEDVRKAVVEFVPASFAAVGAMAKTFYKAEKKHVYLTPKTFLELIKLYKGLLASKRSNVQASIERLEGGLTKLRKTQADVDVLVEQARVMSLEVEQKVSAANKFAEEVGVEKEKVNIENAAAQVEADACATIAGEVSALQARCENDLAAAEPLVAQAEEALNTLNKKDLGELKSLRNPPAGVDDIMAVVLCLLENVPKDKSWAAAGKVMANVDQFLARLKAFKPTIDAGQLPLKNVDACRSYLELPHFNKETMTNKSKAAAGLCEWAVHIVQYYDVWSTVEPKRQELAAANTKLTEANTKLAEVNEKVRELNAKLAALEEQYAAAVADKDAAVAQAEACQRKLDLANRLIAALASEGGRWASTVEQLRRDYQVLTGDVLLSAAFVNYAGPFSSKFRDLLVTDWLKFLRGRGVPMSPGLEDPLRLLVSDWHNGLFDRDKLTLLVALTTQILSRNGTIDPRELEHLCRMPRAAAPPPLSDDLARWMSEGQWAALAPLAQLPAFAALHKDLEKSCDDWERWAASEAPEATPMPGEWSKLSDFRRLLILRALKPDRMPAALGTLCERAMGSAYVNQEPFSARAVLADSSPATPIFFVLFPGYSPSAQIEAYARTVGKTTERGNFAIISLGQGQEGPAERLLDTYVAEGGWLFLDNLHLMPGWIPTLERKLEAAAESAHKDFRCFFSAEPINGAPHARIIPEAILQNCIKIANEPPFDMKSNMRRAWAAFPPEFFDRAPTPAKRATLRSLVFGLCFYHSVLLGRKKYGTGIGSAGGGSGLGYCRTYAFSLGDLTTCGDVIANAICGRDGPVPWADLRYLLGEVFYGGHVVDDNDRRLINTYLDALIRPDLLPDNIAAVDAAAGGADAEGAAADAAAAAALHPPTLELAPGFRPPPPADYDSMRAFIETFPPDAPPLYAMHGNAQLSLLNSQSEALFQAVLEVGGSGGGASGGAGAPAASGAAAGGGEAAVRATLADLLGRLPAQLSMVEIEARVKDKTPFVVVALQETERMNGLLGEMRRGMEELQLGLDGALNMSAGMEALLAALAGGRVPPSWMACMSTRIQEVLGLQAWFADVLQRHQQLVTWTADHITPPPSIWLPGLFNPKACLTAVLQSYARACGLPLDQLRYLVEVTDKRPPPGAPGTGAASASAAAAGGAAPAAGAASAGAAMVGVEPAPDGGVYVHGLTLEGARWDAEEGCLVDSLPNQLRQAMPPLLIRPVTSDQYAAALAAGDLYLCPVYVNMQRANVYSPVVATFTLKTREPPSKWVLASAALLLQDELA